MAFCPNTDCPHRRLTGRPAEFSREVQTCSDCGHGLVDEDPTPVRHRPPCPPALKRRLLVTAAVVAALWLGHLVPQPYLDGELPMSGQGSTFHPTAVYYGPLTQGLLPFLGGFLLVEVVALVHPRLRPRRPADPDLRRKLWRASLVTGAALALVQGWMTGWMLEQVSRMGDFHAFGPPLVENPGIAFRAATALTMAAGSCVFVVAAGLISRYGIGSGFAVVLLAAGLVPVPAHVRALVMDVYHGFATPFQLFLGAGGIAAAVCALWWFFSRNARTPRRLPIVLPTCGMFPLEVALVLAAIPVTLLNLFWLPALAWLPSHLYPGSPLHLALQCLLVCIFVPLASTWFYWRRRREFAAPANRRSWWGSVLASGAFLLALVAFPWALARVSGELLRVFPDVLTIAGVVAVIGDLAGEVTARWNAPAGADLVQIATHQDMADALVAVSRLPVEDGAFLQGLRYRSLTYFLAPYVPLAILAREAAAGGRAQHAPRGKEE